MVEAGCWATRLAAPPNTVDQIKVGTRAPDQIEGGMGQRRRCSCVLCGCNAKSYGYPRCLDCRNGLHISNDPNVEQRVRLPG